MLIHGDGIVSWGNQAFSQQFGIRPAKVKSLKVRELLWCLGIQDPLAGMIAEGVTFDHWEIPPLNAALSALYLRQVRLFDEEESGKKYILMISDSPEIPVFDDSTDEGGTC
ncbi:hypothetical protein CWS72_05540 [Telmatospirillum siberiense]|uniref:PAS domain-containing protein n=1 Tax=Telmatospirillum siberiense TaxID=382514 RepID=A0A2N3PYR5_9PROT|nr:hypothetical protein CWS72_05540 [Telmatospirillum siberiense]